MKTYIGLKQIMAEPQSYAAAHPLVEIAEDRDEPGYKVVYPDGYESWSPQAVFEEAYREIDGAPFSIALEGIKRGEKWTRSGWNGPGQWIAAQIPDEHSKMGAPYIYISPVGGALVPWLASQGDMLGEDWVKVG